MPMAATRVDWVRTRTTAARNSARLRARLPVACETGDKIVMALSSPKTAILLAKIGIRPGNRKRSQGSRSEESRHEKDKDAAKVRRQHRDRVQEGAAFELYSGFVYARWLHPLRRRDVERTLDCAHWLLTEQVIGLGDFSVIRHTS